MKGFERKANKEEFCSSSPSSHFFHLSSVCLTFALCLVLCCASTVLCVALTYMLCKHGGKYMFFQSWSYYIENMASRSTKTCCRTHVHALVWTPPSLGLDCYTYTSNFVLKNVEKR